MTSMCYFIDVGDSVLVKRTPTFDHGERYELVHIGDGGSATDTDTDEFGDHRFT